MSLNNCEFRENLLGENRILLKVINECLSVLYPPIIAFPKDFSYKNWQLIILRAREFAKIDVWEATIFL